MPDPWLHILGIVAAFLGFATLEDARRGRRLRPLTFFWSGLALYLVYANQLTPTLDPIDGETVAAVGLLFCAASPVIGWVWWGQHGLIRRRLLRFIGFVVLLVVSFVVWTLILGPVAEATIRKTFWIHPDEEEALRRAAFEQRRSEADLVREALRRFFDIED